MIDTVPKPTGRFIADIFERGELIEHIDDHNLIVVGYQKCLSKLLGGSDPALWAITQIGVGTNAVAPTFAQTVLTSPVYIDITSVSYPATNSVSFAFTIGTGDANGTNISEFGLLSGNNTLFSRKTRTAPLVKTIDISVVGHWIINFN